MKLFQLLVYKYQCMNKISLSGKKIKEINEFAEIHEGKDPKGRQYFIKTIKNNLAEKYGISDAIDYNREVLSDIDQFPFPDQFIKILSQISIEEIVGFVIDPYECTLEEHIQKKAINEKEALDIFQQILKSFVSLYKVGYWHKNIRPEHFVKIGAYWKLESLVFNEDYSKSNGKQSQYLWNPEFQAPECYEKDRDFSEDDFERMFVWNLGALLLNILVGVNKLSSQAVLNKFKNESFSFEKIGVKTASKFSEEIKDLLSKMLHHNPTKRMKLIEVFKQQFFSKEVAIVSKDFKPVLGISNSKIASSIKSVSKIISGVKDAVDKSNIQMLVNINLNKEKEEINRKKLLQSSKLPDIAEDDEFFFNLKEVSNRIPSKKIEVRFRPEKKVVEMESLTMKNSPLRKSFELYKNLHDQSELLALSVKKIEQIHYNNDNEKQIRLLNKYAIMFMSLINLNILTDNINTNHNFLSLDADLFNEFRNQPEYEAFKEILNYKREQRQEELNKIKIELGTLKNRKIPSKFPNIQDFQKRDYRRCYFSDIKTPYRTILKMSYDAVSEQYNARKKAPEAEGIARLAMYVTFCMTVDKLYIRDDIEDNFKFYFIWIKKPASEYVPVHDFNQYIENAPKATLVEHSRFILEKYYNI